MFVCLFVFGQKKNKINQTFVCILNIPRIAYEKYLILKNKGEMYGKIKAQCCLPKPWSGASRCLSGGNRRRQGAAWLSAHATLGKYGQFVKYIQGVPTHAQAGRWGLTSSEARTWSLISSVSSGRPQISRDLKSAQLLSKLQASGSRYSRGPHSSRYFTVYGPGTNGHRQQSGCGPWSKRRWMRRRETEKAGRLPRRSGGVLAPGPQTRVPPKAVCLEHGAGGGRVSLPAANPCHSHKPIECELGFP